MFRAKAHRATSGKLLEPIWALEVRDPCPGVIWNAFDHMFGGVFFVEMVIKLAVLHLAYFKDRWNLLDGTLAIMGFMDTWFLSLSPSRVFLTSEANRAL